MAASALPTEERVAYSPEEVAQMMGLGRTTVRNMLARGELGYTRAGGRVLISRAHLDAFLSRPPALKVKRPGYGLPR